MTSQQNRQGTPTGNAGGGNEASGKHQGLRQPADDTRDEDAIDNVGLKDPGAEVEDHLRDKRGKGVRGGFDDSIDHDADRDQVSNEQVANSPRKT
ncbi:hypothetical protein [Novilysobacter spongiicola]|uniref:Uncharacterized protein n=1 Tax=Lysobacter spongiicola DSM 21749 TaxID=1122188 RepID=A0A1T4QQW0_9GAMM|nr:hypothetical protein [Lysobacter spongiicola]SKA05648.1 hypothetical protein SAMN02745674_01759 [Lysobacter spongiicola DSM 21749]